MKIAKIHHSMDIKNLEKIMEFLSRQLFDLKDTQFWILYKIAEEGPMYKNQLKNQIGLTKRRIDYNVQVLTKKGFLQAKKKRKSHRQIKNAFGKGIIIKPTLYHLKFKGLIASLGISLRQNYLIQNYMRIVEEYTDKKFCELFLEHIHYTITLFLLKNYMRKSNFSQIQENLDWAIYNMYDFSESYDDFYPYSDISFLTSKHQELFKELVEKFHISSIVLGNLLKHFKSFTKDSKDTDDMINEELTDFLIRKWSTVLLPLYTKNYKKIIEEKIEDFDSNNEGYFEYYWINVEAQEIYKKLKPKGEFESGVSLIQS